MDEQEPAAAPREHRPAPSNASRKAALFGWLSLLTGAAALLVAALLLVVELTHPGLSSEGITGDLVLAGLGIVLLVEGVLLHRQRLPRDHLVPANVLLPGETIRVTTSARSGPPASLVWIPVLLGVSMTLAGDYVGAVAGWAGIALVGLTGAAIVIVWRRRLGVVLTDRRLLLYRATQAGGFKDLVLAAPRGVVVVRGFHLGIVTFGAVEFVVVADGFDGTPIRLTFWGLVPGECGRTIYAGLASTAV